MNIELFLIAVAASDAVMPKIIFWVLWAIGGFGFFTSNNPPNTTIVRGTHLLQIILFGILGYYTFNF